MGPIRLRAIDDCRTTGCGRDGADGAAELTHSGSCPWHRTMVEPWPMFGAVSLYGWVLLSMFALSPRSPWLSSYPAIAGAIAAVSESAPLYPGHDGPQRTAALLVAVAAQESAFNPNALGDHGGSHGLFQVNAVWAPRSESIIPWPTTWRARDLIARSLEQCAARPEAERLAWFFRSGGQCSPLGAPASRRRMALAERLLHDSSL